MDFGAFSAKNLASCDCEIVYGFAFTSLLLALAICHISMIFIRQDVAVWFQAE